jgi:hypothetical protein
LAKAREIKLNTRKKNEFSVIFNAQYSIPAWQADAEKQKCRQIGPDKLIKGIYFIRLIADTAVISGKLIKNQKFISGSGVLPDGDHTPQPYVIGRRGDHDPEFARFYDTVQVFVKHAQHSGSDGKIGIFGFAGI